MVDPGVVQDHHRLFPDRIGHPVEEGDDGRGIDPVPGPALDQGTFTTEVAERLDVHRKIVREQGIELL